MGYCGGMTTVKNFVREVRPYNPQGYEHRFETPPGKQAQVDFAHFKVRFTDEPSTEQVVWLFSMVLGNSRFLFCRYVTRQDLPAVVRCHVRAFSTFGGVPKEILYDRMKTAVIGEDAEGQVLFNKTLLSLADHYSFKPLACASYRAKTKGKVERFNHYLRYSFHNGLKVKLSMKNYKLNLENANIEVIKWLDIRANKRIHSTTLQQPFKLLLDEQPHLLHQPKPYNGVHPKIVVDNILKNSCVVNNRPANLITIPNRDLQGYDNLIPITMITIVPALSHIEVLLWS